MESTGLCAQLNCGRSDRWRRAGLFAFWLRPFPLRLRSGSPPPRLSSTGYAFSLPQVHFPFPKVRVCTGKSNMGREELLRSTKVPLYVLYPFGFAPLHGLPRGRPGNGLAIAEAVAVWGYVTVIMSRSQKRMDRISQRIEALNRQRVKRDDKAAGSEPLSCGIACEVFSTESIRSAIETPLSLFPDRELDTAV